MTVRHTLPLAFCIFLLASCGAPDRAAVASPTAQPRAQIAAYPGPPTATLHPLDATKQAIPTEDAYLVETAVARPTRSTPYVFQTEPSIPPIPQPTGFSLDCEGIDGTVLMHKTNCWYGLTAGRMLDVHAGEALDKTGYGAIVVYYGNNHAEGYTTPQETGSITITGVQDGFFTFRGENGTTVIFDTATRQWVASVPERTPDTALPTAAPLVAPDADTPTPSTLTDALQYQ